MEYVTYDQFRRHKHDGIETDQISYDDLRGASSTSSYPLVISTNFDDPIDLSARYGSDGAGSISGSGSAYGGLHLETGSGAGQHKRVTWSITDAGSATLEKSSNVLQFIVQPKLVTTGSGEGDFFCGLGNPTASGASGITTTDSHIGFMLKKRSGVITLYATHADGTAEQVSSLTTVAQGDVLKLRAVIGASSVAYYWVTNNGDWSQVTTLTGNLPTNQYRASFSTSNRNTAFEFNVTVAHASITIP